jgi:hypothetical protein
LINERKYPEKNLSHANFFHRKSHAKWPRIKPGRPWWYSRGLTARALAPQKFASSFINSWTFSGQARVTNKLKYPLSCIWCRQSDVEIFLYYSLRIFHLSVVWHGMPVMRRDWRKLWQSFCFYHWCGGKEEKLARSWVPEVNVWVKVRTGTLKYEAGGGGLGVTTVSHEAVKWERRVTRQAMYV